MRFKLGDWVNHPFFGHGQITDERESFFVVRFVTQGKRKITMGFQMIPGNPPAQRAVIHEHDPVQTPVQDPERSLGARKSNTDVWRDRTRLDPD
jgi:hypothetical protein